MSLRALTLALEHQHCPSPSAKLVLLVFANFADARGHAWPSTETVKRITGLDLKTVRGSIDALEDAGIIADTSERKGRTRQVKVYQLTLESHPDMEAFPERSSPDAPAEPQETATATARQSPPKAVALKAPVFPAKGTQKRMAEPVTGTDTPKDPDGSLPPRGRKRDRGSKMSEDWAPCPIIELPDRIRTIAAQWPAGAYETLAEAHRAHHAAGGRSKRDWDSDWRARIVQLGAQPLRDARAGMRFEALPAAAALPEPMAFAKSGEVAPLAAWREAAAATMGAGNYRRLLDDADLAVDDEQLVVTVSSSVVEMTIRENYEYRLAPLVRSVLHRRLLRVEVRRHAA